MSQDWLKVICTVGPSSRNPTVLRRMEGLGVSAFRINLSHTPIDDVAPFIREIREVTGVPICLDTEGAQIRTGRLPERGLELHVGETVWLASAPGPFDRPVLTLNPPQVFSVLESGTLLSVDFDACLLMVVERRPEGCLARVVCSGRVGSNKAVVADREIPLPSLTGKDRQAIAKARELGVTLFSFSFASDAAAVRALRECVGSESIILSKIESRSSLLHLDEIIKESDGILIDRGDLSRSTPLEEIPSLQKLIIRKAHQKPIPAYVATNLLESMVSSPYPTRAEVNDIANTLFDGANGLVLAAETAIGKYPVQCVNMVMRLIRQHQDEVEGPIRIGRRRSSREPFVSIPPHGGRLTERLGVGSTAEMGLSKLHRLNLDSVSLREMEQVAFGSYSPLEGFMNRRELESVLDRFKLPNGTVWPTPVILPMVFKQVEGRFGETVSLQCTCCEEIVGLLEINDIYSVDSAEIARHCSGQRDGEAELVSRIDRAGGCCVGGRVTLLKPHSQAVPVYLSLSPARARSIFAHRGWDRVLGYWWNPHSELLQESRLLQWLEKRDADGLFIQIPLSLDFERGSSSWAAVLGQVDGLEASSSLRDRVLMGVTFLSSWHSGLRGMVLRMLIHKNYGCSETIISEDAVGEEVTGEMERIKVLLDEWGDVGIRLLYPSEESPKPFPIDHRSKVV